METINVDQLKGLYPKAFVDYREWVTKVTGLKDEKEADLYADMIMINTPRMLYDFFDIKEIFISIAAVSADWFNWSVGEDGEGMSVGTRNEAEQQAIVQAFRILEAKL